ncbi:hypothetical protein MKW98_005414 [Papaver atlanticum]|uniref:Uncharacterized protein n=1 Tax=Papaver atlanticum TaxID=357466 RepID=A0AAD4X536_9MAGN|nr:hypothetical protein MKW98_005414 [Papaver atlanticum]
MGLRTHVKNLGYLEKGLTTLNRIDNILQKFDFRAEDRAALDKMLDKAETRLFRSFEKAEDRSRPSKKQHFPTATEPFCYYCSNSRRNKQQRRRSSPKRMSGEGGSVGPVETGRIAEIDEDSTCNSGGGNLFSEKFKYIIHPFSIKKITDFRRQFAFFSNLPGTVKKLIWI